ncbi:hypothetical protein BIW11_03623 [Tropilaelaps mercedesae]|uniref:Uncharacterized protein n=1 Tax=Tropilaelaps mercedesae TaxID=418985 RepID=A0A1V9XI64_9ACAR|nr:hypothetical protein BIW11_03623 [Tropilaelaps mercedesae]
MSFVERNEEDTCNNSFRCGRYYKNKFTSEALFLTVNSQVSPGIPELQEQSEMRWDIIHFYS